MCHSRPFKCGIQFYNPFMITTLFEKSLSLLLAVSLLQLLSPHGATATTNTAGAISDNAGKTTQNSQSTPAAVKSGDARDAAKIKDDVAKLGIGPDARVELRLRDGTKLKGYILEAADDHLAIVVDETRQARQILYTQVKKLRGKNHFRGEYIAIILVIGLIVVNGIGYARK